MSDQTNNPASDEVSRTRVRSQPLITSRERLWLLVVLVWFMLVAAAITAPLAIALFHPPRQSPRTDLVLHGDDAAQRGWPVRTPHAEPWPPPKAWQGTWGFGHRYFQVHAEGRTPGENGFQLQVHQYGFPLPIVEDASYWWNWNDPTLTGPESSPAMRLLWPGLILNPLIVGGAAYLILMTPIVTFVLGKRVARRAADRCLYCGYPRGESAVCTECGKVL